MLIDAVQSVGRFIKITEAKVHDKNFLKELDLISYSMVVFDRAYNYYHQFALWTTNSVFFVTRIKKNALYTVVELLQENQKQKAKAMVPILVPLFVSAFRRANDLATAMEARCYHGGEGRTKMKPLHYISVDYKAYVVMVLYLAVVIVIRISI